MGTGRGSEKRNENDWGNVGTILWDIKKIHTVDGKMSWGLDLKFILKKWTG